MHRLWQRNRYRRSFYDYKPFRWFVRELELMDAGLTVKWGKFIDRWIIYCQGEPSHIVQNQDGSFRQLDQRILRKLRVDNFLTHNPEALEAYLGDDDYALSMYTHGGFERFRDYLEMQTGE